MKFSGKVRSDHGTSGRPDSVLGQFGETARCRDAQHGDAFVVLSHHSLFIIRLYSLEMGLAERVVRGRRAQLAYIYTFYSLFNITN